MIKPVVGIIPKLARLCSKGLKLSVLVTIIVKQTGSYKKGAFTPGYKNILRLLAGAGIGKFSFICFHLYKTIKTNLLTSNILSAKLILASKPKISIE